MKRFLLLFVVVVLAVPILVGVVQAQIGRAEDASSTIVGTWLRTGGVGGGGASNLYTFNADGTAMATDRDGAAWLGAWEAAGDGDVVFTFRVINANGNGMAQSLRFPVPAGVDEIPFGPGALERIVSDE